MATRRVQLIGGGVAIATVLVAAACGGNPVPKIPAKVTITPANGGQDVKPDSPVQVAVTSGQLQRVTVQIGTPTKFNIAARPGTASSSSSSSPQAAPSPVTGDLTPDGKSWQSKGYLVPDTAYTVMVTTKGYNGKVTTKTSTFHTLKPAQPLAIKDLTPDVQGEKVGIGMPIIVTFNHAVKNRAAVEKMLSVTAEKPAEGAWRWIDDGTQVIYRTKDYWQPYQTVTFTAKLTGVPGGNGMYGTKDITRTIQIGSAQVSTISVPESTMSVTRDGAQLRSFTISAGSGDTREYTTTSGIHLAMEKDNPVIMESPGRGPGDSGYYRVSENWAVRISDSGEYTHESDPYSPSHGCVHLAQSNASWFFNLTQRGDVILVTGTDRKLAWDNGWGMWQMPFDQWQLGSALASKQAQS